VAKTDLPAGLPGWVRAECIGCSARVTQARDAWVTIVGTRSASWLSVFPTEPQRIGVTDAAAPCGEQVFLLGVAHRRCTHVARERLEAGQVLLPDELPTVSMSEPSDFRYELHLPPTSSSCPFCGATDDLTDEHIWPKWFSRRLREIGATFRSSRNPGKSVQYIDLTVPVCAACNQVWMSVLENDVAELLSPMVCGEPAILSSDNQRVISTWATKTAYLIDAATGPIVPRGYAHSLRDSRRPPRGTVVWLSAFEGPTSAGAAWKRAYRFADHTGWRPDDANGYAITFTAFRVLFQVFGQFSAGDATTNDDRHGLRPALTRIWPAVGDDVSWPPSRAFSNDSVDLLIESIVDGANHADA